MGKNKITFAVLTILFVSLWFAAPAPAGPGDSSPLGPGPHCIIHQPATVSHTASLVTVWGHPQHFNCGGMDSNLYANGHIMTFVEYATTNWGTGTFDAEMIVNVSSLNLQAGQTITWTYEGIDWCDYASYTAQGTSTVN